MKNFKKLFLTASIALTIVGCSKNDQVVEEQAQTLRVKETINKMVTITNEQTKILQSEIEVLASRKAKMRIGQYNNFVRGHMEQYVGR